MRLIGVNGFKRTGKGAVADIVADAYEGAVVQVGFADKIKIIAARALGFDRSDAELISLIDDLKIDSELAAYYSVEAAPLHVTTGRAYLQNFGNTAREVFGADFWVDQVLPRPRTLIGSSWYTHVQVRQGDLQVRYPAADCVVITDLRYENEAERVHALGGAVWEVTRPGVESDGHASEQPLPRNLVDVQIANDADLPTLEGRVKEALIL